ncbi:UDP-3-O-acyl-N-acetylglucosamine deacetylase [Anaeromyxobacter paludicola]|uniref:UDP-3-O-acyl-N-acetylglucosamine deacetylase n=1 Tax=Anaeromyxobacter paludicola TaxID=2918171 RepID=A0ABM7X983_9BACT|nr:UDP-3-O-acyl-N-acetylglucosamine deacetylase [Anaeromyxobacter paludicola]BDG08409.1 UDP-3-O-acyl-N-acetylglucosamine deacetylase [Anaeromyxobacter paludicola]
MSYWKQRTISRRVSCTGVGLHSGAPARLVLAPAPPDTGIRFVRADLGVEIPARADAVVDTTLSTTLGAGDARVATVEHVLAALTGLGVDNCRVEVDGPEVPILDGSAAPFVYLVQEAGIALQPVGKRFLVVSQAVEVKDGDRSVRLEPARELSLRFVADFSHPLITEQVFGFTFSDRSFAREVAPARTFCLLKDVEAMRARGLARGGSLENAIVVDEFSILNPGGLRFPDEFARHKVLDALGDLTLAGMPLIGALSARKSGHAMNQALVRKLLETPAAHRVIRVSGEKELEPLQIRLPALALPGTP